MITKSCIESLNNLDILDVCRGLKIDLKNKGGKWEALSPFKTEKTPSFKIAPGNRFVCFSTGIKGSVITLVMQVNNLTFYDACRWLADNMNVQLEYEESDKPKQSQEDYLLYAEYVSSLKELQAKYYDFDIEHSEIYEYLLGRYFSEETIAHFGLGQAQFEKEGLCLSIPLYNLSKSVIGFSFRIQDKNRKEGLPKYINPTETITYKKDNFLYGFAENIKEISQKRFVYVVEGYSDVWRMWQIGAKNTVASCGTAFTKNQMAMLRRYADDIILAFDNDEAGQKANIKLIPELLKAGFTVSIMKVPSSGEKSDPDSFFSEMEKKHKEAGEIFSVSKLDLYTKHWTSFISFNSIATAKDAVELLDCIDDKPYKISCIESLYERCGKGISKKVFKEILQEDLEEKQPVVYNKSGMWIDARGLQQVANFHLYIRYKLLEFPNENDFDAPKAATISAQEVNSCEWFIQAVSPMDAKKVLFQSTVTNDQLHEDKELSKLFSPLDYIVKWNNSQLKLWLSHSLEKRDYRDAMQIDCYGYCPQANVLVFSNAVFNCENGKELKANENGFYEKDGMFLSVYKETDIPTLNEFKYTPSGYDFSKWWDKYTVAVPGLTGEIVAAYGIAMQFRNIITNYTNKCPLMFVWGPKGTGKTEAAERITSWTGGKRINPSLKSKNTPKYLLRRLSKVRNGTWVFDEYREENQMANDLGMHIYENKGYGVATTASKKSTEYISVRAGFIATANYKPNDLVFFDRFIAVPKKDKKKEPEQKAAYRSLLMQEVATGFGDVSIDLMKNYKLIRSEFPVIFDALSKVLEKVPGSSPRSVSNIASILTPVFILVLHKKINFVQCERIEQIGKELIRIHAQVTQENSVATELLDYIQSEVSYGRFLPGVHFKYSTKNQDELLINASHLNRGFLIYAKQIGLNINKDILRGIFEELADSDYNEIYNGKAHWQKVSYGKDGATFYQHVGGTSIALSKKRLSEVFDFELSVSQKSEVKHLSEDVQELQTEVSF